MIASELVNKLQEYIKAFGDRDVKMFDLNSMEYLDINYINFIDSTDKGQKEFFNDMPESAFDCFQLLN
jgi:hypothetical protein